IEGVVSQVLAGWAGLIVVLVATAGFVPSMLTGGTAHLFLAKPVRRSTLLLGKYAGGVAFVAMHASIVTVLVVLAVYLRSGWFPAAEGFVETGRRRESVAKAAAEVWRDVDGTFAAWTSAAFTAAVLALGCLVFSRRDY